MERAQFNILVVESVPDRYADLVALLRRDGHPVEVVSSVALHPLGTHSGNPQLILLDLDVLGAGTAGERLRALSRLTGLADVPVILLAPDDRLEFELLDVYDFLAEPIDIFRLQADIERLLAAPPGRPPVDALTNANLQPFQSFLAEHSGLHFTERNSRLLEQGLHRRMCAVGVESLGAYRDYLQCYAESRNELKKLLSLLTVGETSFFRYSSHRAAFIEQVLPDLIERRRRSRTLRIWSAGCSTGEEPYGIAILLAEHFPELADWRVQILATDINKRSLRTAREGVYGRRAMRLVDEPIRSRYFDQFGALAAVKPAIRDRVRFEYLNLAEEVYPSPRTATDRIDLIFCRNVMIYFEPETTRQIVDRFADCLNPGGYLLLGHSESLQNISDRFESRQAERAFYYQLAEPQPAAAFDGPVASSPACAPPVSPDPPAPTAPAAKVAGRQGMQDRLQAERLFHQAQADFHREDFGAAEAGFNAVLALREDHLGALIGSGLICANRGDYAAAAEICERARGIDDLCPDIYFLRGMIADMESRPAEAIAEYQKVLWLDADFISAHYALSRLYRQSGAAAAARRALLNSVHRLENRRPSARIHFSGGMTREVFLELCRTDLDRLDS